MVTEFDVIGADELPTFVILFNQIFRPARDVQSSRRRYLNRQNENHCDFEKPLAD